MTTHPPSPGRSPAFTGPRPGSCPLRLPRRSRPSSATWPQPATRPAWQGPGAGCQMANCSTSPASRPRSPRPWAASPPSSCSTAAVGAPTANIALRTYQAQLVPALAERGISLIAISPQAPDGSLSTKESKELTFTVLSDPGNQIAGQLGILTAPSDGTRAAQLQLGLDLTQVNADGTTVLPMPTVVIADADGGHPVDRCAPRLHHQDRTRPGPAGGDRDDQLTPVPVKRKAARP